MESPQLALLLPCKPCSKLPKDSPNLGFRPFTLVGFGSLWRNHAKSACLMARSSVNISGGCGSGAHDSFGNDSERKGFNLISPSDINDENLEDKNYQLLEIQLKGIQGELRKNNEEIKMLRETAERLWGGLCTAVIIAISMQHLIDNNRKHAQQLAALDNTTVAANTPESAIGTEQTNQLQRTPEPENKTKKGTKRKSCNTDIYDMNPKKPYL